MRCIPAICFGVVALLAVPTYLVSCSGNGPVTTDTAIVAGQIILLLSDDEPSDEDYALALEVVQRWAARHGRDDVSEAVRVAAVAWVQFQASEDGDWRDALRVLLRAMEPQPEPE